MIALTDQPFDPGGLLTEFCQGRTETGAVATKTMASPGAIWPTRWTMEKSSRAKRSRAPSAMRPISASVKPG